VARPISVPEATTAAANFVPPTSIASTAG